MSQSVGGGNTAAETLGNAWQSKQVITRDISIYEGMPIISLNKLSCLNSRLKQGEMCKSMEYEERFKQHQNLFKDLGTESISIEYAMKKPK